MWREKEKRWISKEGEEGVEAALYERETCLGLRMRLKESTLHETWLSQGGKSEERIAENVLAVTTDMKGTNFGIVIPRLLGMRR